MDWWTGERGKRFLVDSGSPPGWLARAKAASLDALSGQDRALAGETPPETEKRLDASLARSAPRSSAR